MKLDLSKFKNKKNIIRCAAIAACAVCAITAFCIIDKSNNAGDITEADYSGIQVTDEEMQQYRDKIGSDMDIKNAVLILFETEEECRNFINTHGADENPLAAGAGIVPLMDEDGYYNIVGKERLENVFDSLSDGEYSKEPIAYSNLFCYLKRIGIDSPTKNNDELKKIIQNDKYQQNKREEK